MNWSEVGSRYLSPPYQIVRGIRGYQLWLKTDGHYGILARDLPLQEAKKLAEQHAMGVTC